MSSDHVDVLAEIEALAARIAQAPEADKRALLRQYLEAVGHHLAAQGRGHQLAFPLLDAIELLEPVTAQPPTQVERRTATSEPSDELLAMVSAAVDILISSGYSQEHACQIVTRQMIARNVKTLTGGDARAWRNLQAWRQKLLASKPPGLWQTYQAHKDDLIRTYGARLSEVAPREAIWDRRDQSAPA